TTYNQFIFLNFVDASIAHTDAALAHGTSSQGFVGQNASVREFNTALVVFTVVDNANGTSAPGATVTRVNAAPLSPAKTDNLDNDTTLSNPQNVSTLNIETFGNQLTDYLLDTCCVFGPDEGLGDTTAFFIEKHSSALAVTGDSNVDAELGAVVLQPNGNL